jgi:hypothetical protein
VVGPSGPLGGGVALLNESRKIWVEPAAAEPFTIQNSSSTGVNGVANATPALDATNMPIPMAASKRFVII